MKLFDAKKNPLGEFLAQRIRKIVICSALLLPLSLIVSCSDDDKKNDAPTSYPYSVGVSDKNQNMPSGGMITSEFSDSPSGSDISKIVDNDLSTKFVTYHSSFYIKWAGSKKMAINYYTLTSAADAPDRDPKSWTLSGSKDNSTWTVIDTRENQTFSKRGQKNEYQFNNNEAYYYYRLDVKSNNGGSATQIAEWTMAGTQIDIDDLMQYASGSSHSNITPMGIHYENRHVTTDADRVWLKTASNEPVIPSSVGGGRMKEFDVTLYPFGKPIPADVNQHGIGDCSALAVFASMTYLYPDFIETLIRDNGDKTYTVSMFDPQGKRVEVTVTSKFIAEDNGTIKAVSGKNNKATWATVLEKAIMKYNAIYKVQEDIGGIGSEIVAPLFTGNGDSFAFYPGTLTSDQLARAAVISLKQGKLVVGGFNRGGIKIENFETVTAHAFTVMHPSDPTALFAMRNPWGWSPNDNGYKLDGVGNIPDDGVVPGTIDFRIMDPGIAAQSGNLVTVPYTPPSYSVAPDYRRVASYILRQVGL